jgi:hypothetical protein
MGLKVGDDTLYTLYFTDDQVVIVEDKDNLSYMVRKLQAYEQRGLLINNKKSKYVIFGNNEKEDLALDDDYIWGVYTCKHLEVLLNKTGYSNEETNNRVNNGRNIIRSLHSTL